jgi:hypothetical protein
VQFADFEGGNDLTLLGAFAHQRRFAARAECERKSVKQDRLAGAGFAGQHGEAGTEIDVQAIYENNIAD